MRAKERYRQRTIVWLAFLLPTLGFGMVLSGAALRAQDYVEEPIRYLQATPTDAIAALQQRLDSGAVQLTHDDRHGYLLSVLQQLYVPVSSQMLVFSKTSFQRDRIAPQTPRAVYFNDRVYIGWVQDGDYVEVASVDPQLGAVFYVLAQTPTDHPRFVRKTYECLQCHDTGMAGNVPGHIMRSVYPDRQGNPIIPAGTFVSSDQSPLSERWGGWYVTGRHGTQHHMGNMVAQSEATPELTDWAKGGNLIDLRKVIDTAPYLTPHSDIVALMVAEHQTQIQNALTRTNYETRRAMQYEQMLNRSLEKPEGTPSESATGRIRSVCEKLVRAMLFSREAQLTAPITGTSGFAARFATYGPQDSRGRSLRQFDLTHRLFRYPCSYEIYSAAFDGLPTRAKDRIYARLIEILTGRDQTPEYAYLSPTDRQSLLEILRDTKPEFASALSRKAE